MNVKSRIHRTIRNSDNYYQLENSISDIFVENFNLQNDEIAYGVYENFPQNKNERIVITNKGVHLYKEKTWVFIDFCSIKSVSVESEKQVAEYITLYLGNNKTFLLPVRGNKGKFRDVFEFSRFLSRVISDLKCFEES